MHKRITDIVNMKGRKKIVALTAYDYTMARLCERGGVDLLLVGDSAGMVMLGYDSTIPVTMDQMCLFTEAVARARQDALVVSDMPFLSYHTSKDAIDNAARLIRRGADAVKVEGAQHLTDTVRYMTEAGIPVMGHIGLQPQKAEMSDGYGTRGKSEREAEMLVQEAISLEEAGIFSLILEKVSYQSAQMITQAVDVPTIGIGSGVYCDGQILVTHDMLGLYSKNLKFVKEYAHLSEDIQKAVSLYRRDVEKQVFPGSEHRFGMDDA